MNPALTAKQTLHPVTQRLTEHYDHCLSQHGPTPQGMDWGPHEDRLNLRFATLCRAMEVDRSSRERPVRVLDVGCGCGLFLEYLQAHWPGRVEYAGLDASSRMIEAAAARHPHIRWMVGDITQAAATPMCDWVVANGVLTEKRDVPHEEMIRFAGHVASGMFDLCRVGIVFNVLTSHVNFQDPALFYWDPGELIDFACTHLSRHVTLFHDLSIFDVFCCVRKQPWSAPEHAA